MAKNTLKKWFSVKRCNCGKCREQKPSQVVGIAVLFSLCCRNFDLNEDDDLEDDEYDPTVVDDEDFWPPAAGPYSFKYPYLRTLQELNSKLGRLTGGPGSAGL